MKRMPHLNENEEMDASSEELDRMLKAFLREPEGPSARIRAAVRQEEAPRATMPRFQAWRWWASAAAVLLIVAGIGVTGVGRKALAAGQPAIAAVGTSPQNAAPVVEQSAMAEAPAAKQSAAAEAPVVEKKESSSEAVTVASSAPQAVRLVGVNAGGKISSAENGFHGIAPVVLHRWMVKDIAEARAFLEEYAKAHGVQAVPVDKEAASLGFRLSDKELQKLVDWLHAGKWRLLSTQYPLPERAREVRFTGADVQYVVDLTLVP